MRPYERLINYTKFETASLDGSPTYPSQDSELVFGRALCEELTGLGCEDVNIDKYGYVTATVPSNVDYDTPVISFIAHMDTVRDVEFRGVKTVLHENYDGNDVVLNEKENIVMKVEDFPVLKNYVGKTLLTTDGTTLLGADDKAGIAEIMSAIEIMMSDPSIKHGKVRVAFTPDEEIGAGVDYFDVEGFKADYGYTLDGASFGEIEYETFNAAAASITINGYNIHPGESKGRMKNAILYAAEYISLLPSGERPDTTEGYEGFYHPTDLTAVAEKATINYILRDHDKALLEKKKAMVKAAADFMNAKYGEGTCVCEVKDSYENMAEKVKGEYHIVETAQKCIRELGATPVSRPIRGGTDGCRLSFMGLVCPNLGTGSHNHHGKMEYAVVEEMDKCTKLVTLICQEYGKIRK